MSGESGTSLRLVIATGGTGGHLYPGIALAEAFLKADPKTALLFVGTEGSSVGPIIKKAGFTSATIVASGFIGKQWRQKVKAITAVPVGILQSVALLRQFRPSLVISTGGYVGGPIFLAAGLLGIKRILLEPNRVPGLTNRLLAPIAHLVVTAFEKSAALLRSKHVVCLGMPIRSDMGALVSHPSDGTFRVLVLGGSQGAHSINSAMMEAIPLLSREFPGRIRVVHQTGITDCEAVSAAYKNSKLEAVVVPFIDDMARAYHESDLTVSRAGAGTLAELAALGVPAILIPYPGAERHQEANAAAFVEAGAAEMILDVVLCGEKIVEHIRLALTNPERLLSMREAMRRRGRPTAAEEIVRHCYWLVMRTPSTAARSRRDAQ